MINHLILLTEEQDLHVTDGKLISGHRKIAIDTLGSVQCLSADCRWSQTALELLATQCPVVMARWDKQQKKWRTFSLDPKRALCEPDRAVETLPSLAATRHASCQRPACGPRFAISIKCFMRLTRDWRTSRNCGKIPSTGFCVWRPATPVFSGRVILPPCHPICLNGKNASRG